MKNKKKLGFIGFIKKFFEPMKAAPLYFTITTLHAIAAGIFATVSVIFLEQITKSIEMQNMSHFWSWTWIWGAVTCFWFGIGFWTKKIHFKTIRDADTYIYKKYMKKYFDAENNATEKLGTGRAVSIFEKGLFAWMYMIVDIRRIVSEKLCTLIIALIVIATRSITFFFVGMVVFGMSIAWILIIQPKAVAWRKRAKEISIEMDRDTVRNIMSKNEIVQQKKTQYELQKRKEKNALRFILKVKEKMLQVLTFDGAYFFSNVFKIVVIVVFGLGVARGIYTFSDFVLLTGLAVLLSAQIKSVTNLGRQISDNRIHTEKMRDVFDNLPVVKNIEKGKQFSLKKGNIIFQNISFSYDKAAVLKNIDIKIAGGKKTAFVGPSGGGKSTLIKLIAGYLQAKSGKILVDNQDISKISLTSYYQHIGYLTQEPSIFDGTIRENLMYGTDLDGRFNKTSLQKIIKLSRCEFIYDFEDGLDTEIGERGIRLSGGQKQRLAIAKIMLKDPEIILLDEPTSALDSVSEQKISEAFHNLFKGKTVIVVAHRLQTVKEADDILVIDKGDVIERGTHKQLESNGGIYQQMLDLQTTF